MNKPFFTVVIPLYNKQNSVKRAVSSVLSQNFKHLELIVVDDGSTDRSADIVLGFNDARLQLIRQTNSGVSAARNRGIKAAIAEYICFLDADDQWDVNFLETILSLIEVAPEAALYSVNHNVVDENGHIFHRASDFPKSYLGYVNNFYKVYAGTRIINSSSVCIKKESLLKIGGFPEHARIGEDIYTWLRLADIYRVAYANVVRVTIYRDAENRTGERISQEIPCHIKTVLESDANEFTEANRSDVIQFVARNTVFQAAGIVLRGKGRRTAFIMAWMLRKGSPKHSVQVLCVAITPRILLRLIKRLRNTL